MLIDAHVHLDRYDRVGEGAVDAALAEIQAKRILTISNSMDPASYKRNLEIAAGSGLVLPIFGVHPWNAADWAGRLADLRPLAEGSPMLGEVGLDFYCVQDPAAHTAQRQVLALFLQMARDQDKILQLHTRGAEREVLELLDRYQIRRAVVHWYSGPLDVLEALIARGFYFTAGLETHYSEHVLAIVKRIPLDRLLTETDNPGGPSDYLGGPGMPSLIKDVVEVLAEARGVQKAVILDAVRENLARLLAGDRWLDERFARSLTVREPGQGGQAVG